VLSQRIYALIREFIFERLIREGFAVNAGKGLAIRAERESWRLPIPNVRSFRETFGLIWSLFVVRFMVLAV
jgi:hypothetical protein